MKKQLRNVLLVAVALFSAQQSHAADVAINATNFPDQTFRDYVLNSFDSDGDEKLSDEERAAVTSIGLGGIANAKGVEHFTELTSINIYSGTYKTINLASCTKLETVALNSNNKLTTVTWPADKSSITCLDFDDTSVSSFPLSDFTSLQTLYLQRCTSWGETLDISNLSALQNVYITESSIVDVIAKGGTISHVNVNGTEKVKTLDISDDSSSDYIGISGWSALETLIAKNITQSTSFNCDNKDNLVSADLTGSSSLESINLSTNPKLQSVNLTGCSGAREIYLYRDSQLTSVTWPSDKSSITYLDFDDTSVSSFPLSDFTSLQTLYMQRCTNWGETLDISNLASLQNVYITESSIVDVIAKGGTISHVNVSGTEQVKTLDISDDPTSENIGVSNWLGLETLIAKNLSNATYMDCAVNGNLVSVDFTGSTSLQSISLYSNPKLTTVTLTGNTSLQNIYLYSNPNLTTVTWPSDKSSITQIDLDDTSIRSFPLSDFTSLQALYLQRCTSWGETLDISNLASLQYLYITDAGIENVIARGGTLSHVSIYGHEQVKTLDISDDSTSDYIGHSSWPALETLIAKNITKATTFNCNYQDNLVSIDFTGSTSIASYALYDNPKLSSVTWPADKSSVTNIDLDNTGFGGSFTLEGFPNLEDFRIINSGLETFEVSKSLTNLRYLYAYDNHLTSMDLSGLELWNEPSFSDQNIEREAVLLSANEVGFRVDDKFDVSRVTEWYVNDTYQQDNLPTLATVDGVKYLVVGKNASQASSLLYQDDGSGVVKNWYVYAMNSNENTWPMNVRYKLTEVIKCPSFLTLSKTAVSGTYGGSVAAPAVTRSQGYEGTLSYVSSNPAVVTVDASGKLTIVGAGTANITVSGVETDYRQAPEPVSYKVTIRKASPVLSFAQAAVEIEMLDEVPANALTKGVYDGVVNYASSNQAVATVNATTGEVTIVAAGTTTITASGAATANCNAPTAATYTLTVNKKTATITLAATTVSGTYGGTITAPKATATTGYDGKLTYKSSKATVVTVNANTGKLTIKGAGTATITVSGTETDVYKAPTSVTYTVTIAKASPVFSYEKDLVAVNNFTSLPIVDNTLSIGIYDGTVTYTSSDPTVATVDAEGNVTCLKSGTTTITATGAATANCNGSSASFELVTDLIPTGVGSITVDMNDGYWYTPAGIRVDNPRKGQLYIHNGKKVIFK